MNSWYDKQYDTGFWIKQIDWTDTFVFNNMLVIEENYRKFPNKNRWNCNCHTIHDNDGIDEIDRIDYAFLREEYIKTVKEFLKEKGIRSNFYVSDIWYNYYKLGQFQEPHIHDSTFTVIHYMLYDTRYHSTTKFTDKDIVMPEVRSGEAVIFPGFYEHYVEKNTSNVPRLTTAFGITLSQ